MVCSRRKSGVGGFDEEIREEAGRPRMHARQDIGRISTRAEVTVEIKRGFFGNMKKRAATLPCTKGE